MVIILLTSAGSGPSGLPDDEAVGDLDLIMIDQSADAVQAFAIAANSEISGKVPVEVSAS